LIVQQLLAPLEHQETRICVLAERAMNRKLQGGCQVPIGAFAVLQQNELWLRGLVGQLDGSEILRSEIKGEATQAEQLGTQLAEQLLALGADRILDAVYRQA
jgi:hydroxymethylbilane synthase